MLGSTWRRRGRASLSRSRVGSVECRASEGPGAKRSANWWQEAGGGERVVPRKKTRKESWTNSACHRAAIENPKRNGGGRASLSLLSASASMKTEARGTALGTLGPLSWPLPASGAPGAAALHAHATACNAASPALLTLSQQVPCFNNVLPTSDATSTAQHQSSLVWQQAVTIGPRSGDDDLPSVLTGVPFRVVFFELLKGQSTVFITPSGISMTSYQCVNCKGLQRNHSLPPCIPRRRQWGLASI